MNEERIKKVLGMVPDHIHRDTATDYKNILFVVAVEPHQERVTILRGRHEFMCTMPGSACYNYKDVSHAAQHEIFGSERLTADMTVKQQLDELYYNRLYVTAYYNYYNPPARESWTIQFIYQKED